MMSPAEHPAPALLLRFLRCETSKSESRAVLRHLLTGCAKCCGVTQPVWQTADRLASHPTRSLAQLKPSAGVRETTPPDRVPY